MSNTYRSVQAAVSAAALALLVGACSGDKKEGVAELLQVMSGTAEKSRTAAAWEAASSGDQFFRGDSLRTSADGSARVRVVKSVIRLGASTVIRFGEAISVTGEVSTEEEVDLDLELGRARISRGGRIRFGDRDGQVSFEVVFGSATVTRDGQVFELSEGESLAIDIGRATVEKLTPAPIDAGPAPDASPVPVDQLIEGVVKGNGVTIKTADSSKWEKLPKGRHEIAAGSTVRIKARSSVDLERGSERAWLRGAATAEVGPESGVLVRIESGGASAQATERDVVITVPGGTLTLSRGPGDGTKADISVGKKGTSVTATAGRIDVSNRDGIGDTIQLGESATLDKEGAIEVIGRAPEFAEVLLSEARNISIHTLTNNANVGIAFSGECPEAGVVETARNKSFRTVAQVSRGTGSANLRLALGGHQYRVRCIEAGVIAERAAFSGRISVVRDAGTRPLPRAAPSNTVGVDGRRYTVLYQNRLPAITFRWSDAPPASNYTLQLAPKRGKSQSYRLSGPSKSFSSGALREGDYSYWFESPAGSSRKSTLSITFDNAAASGYLSSPRPGVTWGTGGVIVAGAVVRGWRVRVNGQPLPLDGQFRFKTRVDVPESGAIAVEFSHPSRGSHYYLRRNGRP